MSELADAVKEGGAERHAQFGTIQIEIGDLRKDFTAELTGIRDQMKTNAALVAEKEAMLKGGWYAIGWLVTAAAAAGGAVVWVLNVFFPKN